MVLFFDDPFTSLCYPLHPTTCYFKYTPSLLPLDSLTPTFPLLFTPTSVLIYFPSFFIYLYKMILFLFFLYFFTWPLYSLLLPYVNPYSSLSFFHFILSPTSLIFFSLIPLPTSLLIYFSYVSFALLLLQSYLFTSPYPYISATRPILIYLLLCYYSFSLNSHSHFLTSAFIPILFLPISLLPT